MIESQYTELINKLQVNSQTSEPYYKQLERKLLQLIESGEFLLGQGLPSERDMAKALNLSRNTVRRCYENLRKSGQINSDGIKGTVVKNVPYINPVIGKLKGFTQEMQELGIEPSTQLIAYDVMHDRTIASIFQRPSTAKFLRLTRLRLGNDVPMTREVAWYDLTTAPNLENWDTTGSIYDFLNQHCGIALKWAEQSIEAVMSSEEESKVFGYEKASPCLLLKRKSYALKDQLIEYVEGTFRGDAYTYRIKLKI